MTTAKQDDGLPDPLHRILDEYCLGGFFLTYFDPQGNAKTFLKCDTELHLIGLVTRSKHIAQKIEHADYDGLLGEEKS